MCFFRPTTTTCRLPPGDPFPEPLIAYAGYSKHEHSYSKRNRPQQRAVSFRRLMRCHQCPRAGTLRWANAVLYQQLSFILLEVSQSPRGQSQGFFVVSETLSVRSKLRPPLFESLYVLLQPCPVCFQFPVGLDTTRPPCNTKSEVDEDAGGKSKQKSTSHHLQLRNERR